MLKSKAIEVLGGTPTSAAAAMRISASAVSQWPEVLHEALQVRVLAALARRHLPRALLDDLQAASTPPGGDCPDAAA
jgi:hypothetical protein